MKRRLGWAAAILVVLALVADFGAKLIVENLAARALASRRGVNGGVDVSFGGFPFLLHLKDRSFTSMTVSAEDVRGGSFATASDVGAATEARIASARIEMDDVTIDGDLWGDDPDRAVAAGAGRGTASMTGAELNRLVPDQYPVRLRLLDGAVRVTATTPAGEETVEVTEEAVSVEPGGTLTIEAPEPVGSIPIPLPQLVSGVTFRGVAVTEGRLEVEFAFRDLRLEL